MAVTKEQVFEVLANYLWKPLTLSRDGEEYEVLLFNTDETEDGGADLIFNYFSTDTFNSEELGLGNLVIIGVEAALDHDPEALANHSLDVIEQADTMYFVDLDQSTADKLMVMKADLDGGVGLDSMESLTDDFKTLDIKIESTDE